MQEPLSSVVEDNAESIIKQFHGAADATVTVEEEHDDPKKFMLEVTYEGEIENEDQMFYAEMEDEDYIQYLKILNVVNDYIALASYTLVRRDELQKVAQEIEEIEKLR